MFPIGQSPSEQTTGQTRARNILVVMVLIFLGLAAGIFWGFQKGREHATTRMTGGTGSIALSDSTRAVLTNLAAPVEIRFYALLDPASVPPATSDFAGRVDQLLAECQRIAGGR